MGINLPNSTASHFVYVVTDDKAEDLFSRPVKIGVTSNSENRFRSFQTMCPHGLLVFARVPVLSRSTEFELHRLLARFRIRNRGEWFNFRGEFYCEEALFVHTARAEHRQLVPPYSTEISVIKSLINMQCNINKAEEWRLTFGTTERSQLCFDEDFIESRLAVTHARLAGQQKQVLERLLQRKTRAMDAQANSGWKSPVWYFDAPVIKSLDGGLGYASS